MKNKVEILVGDFVKIDGFSTLGPCRVISSDSGSGSVYLNTAKSIPVSNVSSKDLIKIHKDEYLEARDAYLQRCYELLEKYRKFQKAPDGVNKLYDQLDPKSTVKRNKTIQSNIRKIRFEIDTVKKEINAIRSNHLK